MVIVRRKADGLYYNGARSNAGYGKAGWTADIQQCLPYTNERGATGKFFPYIRTENCQCRSKNCEHNKARIAKAKQFFHDRYEIVPVRLAIAKS